MHLGALEKCICVLKKSWKSAGKLFLKKGTNPGHSSNSSSSSVLMLAAVAAAACQAGRAGIGSDGNLSVLVVFILK